MLDPVDPELVGQVNLARILTCLEKTGMKELHRGVMMLSKNRKDLEHRDGDQIDVLLNWLTSELPLEQQGNSPIIARRYDASIEALMKSNIVKVTERRPNWISGYFEVPKGRKKTRAIFSGRRVSEVTPPPPPVNLTGGGALVQRILQFLETERRIFGISGDFRHWFHQLSCGGLATLFGLRHRNLGFLEWCTMPMGWNWSPFFAQCVAWATIVWREDDEEDLFITDAFRVRGAGLPFVLRTKANGLVIVFYDNYLVLTHSQQEQEKIDARLRRNFNHLHVVVKEHTTFKGPTCTFVFLGIRFQCGVDRPCHKRVDYVSWEATGRPDWLRLMDETHGTATPKEDHPGVGKKRDPATLRDGARALGQIICDIVTSGRPVLSEPQGPSAIGLASALGKIASGTAIGWDEPLEEPLWAKIRGLHNLVINREAYLQRLGEDSTNNPSRKRRYVITDASQDGDGWVFGEMIDDRLRVSEPTCRIIPQEEKGRHIYLKELKCALDGLAAGRQLYPDDSLTLVTDNAAVAFSMEKGMSTNMTANRWLENRVRPLGFLDVILVISADNPSDCCSRNDFASFDTRVQKLQTVIQAHQGGYRWHSQPSPFIRENGVEDTMKETLRIRHGLEDIEHSPERDPLEIG